MERQRKQFLITELDRPSSEKIQVLEQYLRTWRHLIESCGYLSKTLRRAHQRRLS